MAKIHPSSDPPGRRFPLQSAPNTKYPGVRLRSMPWAMLAPQEAQALDNHGQTLERLSERGGLSACEALAILDGRCWRKMDSDEANAELCRRVDAYKAAAEGMSHTDIFVACRNVGVDLACGRCAMVFYTGSANVDHDPACKSAVVRAEKIETFLRGLAYVEGQCGVCEWPVEECDENEVQVPCVGAKARRVLGMKP